MADAAGFEGFFREHFPRIVRACALVTLDAAVAEDAAAEAFARLWSRWASIRSEDHAGGWVFKTAVRVAGREARRRSRRAPLADHEAGDHVDLALAREDVARALAGLPLRQRQAIVLRDWAGFGTPEVARMLGTRESTVRVHLARARERLRSALRVQEEVNG